MENSYNTEVLLYLNEYKIYPLGNFVILFIIGFVLRINPGFLEIHFPTYFIFYFCVAFVFYEPFANRIRFILSEDSILSIINVIVCLFFVLLSRQRSDAFDLGKKNHFHRKIRYDLRDVFESLHTKIATC